MSVSDSRVMSLENKQTIFCVNNQMYKRQKILFFKLFTHVINVRNKIKYNHYGNLNTINNHVLN